MPTRLLLSTAAVALLLAGPALAQTRTPPQPMPSTAMPNRMPAQGQQLGKQDLNFIKEAAIGGLAEVELGKLAQQNAQDDQVKQFGAKMEQDHSSANNQLTSIASQKGITLPSQLDKKHAALKDRLSKLQGAAFDRAYMAAMVKDHNEDMRAFQREAQTAKDPDVKQFAANTLQVIEQHDQLAKNVDQSLTATGSSRRPR